MLYLATVPDAYDVAVIITGDKVTCTHRHRHTIHTPLHHRRLSDLPYPLTISTYPSNTPFLHPRNTPSQPTHTLSSHPRNPLNQHSLSTHPPNPHTPSQGFHASDGEDKDDRKTGLSLLHPQQLQQRHDKTRTKGA